MPLVGCEGSAHWRTGWLRRSRGNSTVGLPWRLRIIIGSKYTGAVEKMCQIGGPFDKILLLNLLSKVIYLGEGKHWSRQEFGRLGIAKKSHIQRLVFFLLQFAVTKDCVQVHVTRRQYISQARMLTLPRDVVQMVPCWSVCRVRPEERNVSFIILAYTELRMEKERLTSQASSKPALRTQVGPGASTESTTMWATWSQRSPLMSIQSAS